MIDFLAHYLEIDAVGVWILITVLVGIGIFLVGQACMRVVDR